MAEQQKPLIDLASHRRHFEERRRELAQNPDARKRVIRAKVRIVHDLLKEAQTGQHTFRSDEAAGTGGGGEAPSPLQYFVAAVGF